MNRQLQKVQHLPPLIADDEASFDEACDRLAEDKYSAERLFQRDPLKYRLIVRMISESLSTRMIARACGLSAHTVEAVRIREGFSIEEEKTRLLELVRSASRLCVERLIELIPEMSARDAAIAFGITAEKSLLLQGEPTVVIDSTVNHMLHADLNAILDAIDVQTKPALEDSQAPAPDAARSAADSAGAGDSSTAPSLPPSDLSGQ